MRPTEHALELTVLAFRAPELKLEVLEAQPVVDLIAGPPSQELRLPLDRTAQLNAAA
jgi:hypothetical protein